jgi:hypothetical protein
MTQDEIIEMAVSNGFYKNDEGTITSPFIEDIDISELLLKFAKDVAAKEREACLKICDEFPDIGHVDKKLTCDYHSYLIRLRGEA